MQKCYVLISMKGERDEEYMKKSYPLMIFLANKTKYLHLII